MSRLRHKLIAPVLFFLAGGFGYGETSGSVTGTVRDPQKAVIPDARVTLFARDNTATITVATGQKGDIKPGRSRRESIWWRPRPRVLRTPAFRAVRIEKGAQVDAGLLLQVAGTDSALS